MDDHERDFEERALKNVRALVDNLEKTGQGPEIPWRNIAILGACLLALIAVLYLASKGMSLYQSRDAEWLACMNQARVARASEVQNRIKAEHPDMAWKEIANLAAEENVKVAELAKADCSAKVGKD